jgi:hypothetical protein
MRARAVAISLCSSADGLQTFRRLTFTCGCVEAASGDCWPKAGMVSSTPARIRIVFGSTAEF